MHLYVIYSNYWGGGGRFLSGIQSRGQQASTGGAKTLIKCSITRMGTQLLWFYVQSAECKKKKYFPRVFHNSISIHITKTRPWLFLCSWMKENFENLTGRSLKHYVSSLNTVLRQILVFLCMCYTLWYNSVWSVCLINILQLSLASLLQPITHCSPWLCILCVKLIPSPPIKSFIPSQPIKETAMLAPISWLSFLLHLHEDDDHHGISLLIAQSFWHSFLTGSFADSGRWVEWPDWLWEESMRCLVILASCSCSC